MSVCDAYLDDVVMVISTWQAHLKQIRGVSQHLSNANLKVNLANCKFGTATITYLGKVVRCGQVPPVGANVEAVTFPVPLNRPELQCVLGMVGHYLGLSELCHCCLTSSMLRSCFSEVRPPNRHFMLPKHLSLLPQGLKTLSVWQVMPVTMGQVLSFRFTWVPLSVLFLSRPITIH